MVRISARPGRLPWDRAQTHATIRMNAVEEAWEVVDAIEADDTDALYDELGDLVLQAGDCTPRSRASTASSRSTT